MAAVGNITLSVQFYAQIGVISCVDSESAECNYFTSIPSVSDNVAANRRPEGLF